VWETFVTLAVVYFVFMTAGAFTIKMPASSWKPKGWTPPAPATNSMISTRHVHVDKAVRTPQFWLVWSVLCMNVTAGIGIIGMASPMLQEVFGGALIGVDAQFSQLDAGQLAAVAAIAAGFTGLISLFNIVGRFAWGSSSDLLGRKLTYCVFFVKGYPVDHFAYASIGGPRIIMDYANDGWGPDNIDRVFAHESGHIFQAPDEYASSGCNCGGSWGRFGEPNANCENCSVHLNPIKDQPEAYCRCENNPRIACDTASRVIRPESAAKPPSSTAFGNGRNRCLRAISVAGTVMSRSGRKRSAISARPSSSKLRLLLMST